MPNYQPTLTLTQDSGNDWTATTRCTVDHGEGLSLTSNTVRGAVRVLRYDVAAGPGGPIVENETYTRQSGELRVRTEVFKNDDKQGEDESSYPD